MGQKMTKQEVTEASAALADWFVSQEISTGNAAIVMIHLLGVMTGDRANDANDLMEGLEHIHGSLDYTAARVFAVKHNLI